MKNPKIRFLLRVVLSAALIALLLSRLNWSDVFKLIRGVYLGPLLAGSALAVLGQFLMAERTRLMLRHWSVNMSRRNACSATWIGQFCNNFLPGGIGGDMVKFYRLIRLFPHAKAAVLVALIADRLLALAALVALSTLALACGDRELLRSLLGGTAFSSIHRQFPVWWFVLSVIIVVITFVALLLRRFWQALIEKGARQVTSIRRAVARGGRLDSAVVTAFVLAAMVHALGMICALCFARALAIPLGLGQVFLVWPVVLVAMMLPVSVNGYGLREFILLYYFERWHLFSHLGSSVGIKESVIALSLLSVVNDMLCNLPGGLLLLTAESPAANHSSKPEDRATLSPP